MKTITNSMMPKTAEQLQTISATTRNSSLTIGIDLGDQWSQFCLLDANGTVCEEGRVRSTRSAFQARFGALTPARIALETGTHSLWASELLADLGHEVIVAHVREVRAITGSHSKSDQVDARKLARYARVDPEILHPVRLRDSDQQRDLVLVRARAALVRARSLLINSVRGLVKPFGYRVSSCDADCFANYCREELPREMQDSLGPVVEQIAQLTGHIQDYEKQIGAVMAEKYPDAAPLRSVFGVGPVTALTFVLTLADPQRFAQSRHVGCYLGLRPQRSQSGERDPQLGITKAGNPYLRWLLVECAHRLLRIDAPDSALKGWGQKLCERGGKNAKKRAIVAVARKLAVLLHKLWVTQQRWEPLYGVRSVTATA
jgi:transposase